MPSDRSEASAPIDDFEGHASYSFGSSRTLVDLSLWTGVKLGIGFAIGVALVALTLSLIVIVILGIDVQGRRF